MHRLKKKKLIVFDLDKTLTESKQPMDDEMAELVRRLLEVTNVAVISGGSFKQFQKQFVPKLTKGKLASLFLFPTCGSAFYRYGNEMWKNMYTETLSIEEKAESSTLLKRCSLRLVLKNRRRYTGTYRRSRNTNYLFCARFRRALSIKSVWGPDRAKRLKMISILKRIIPEFEIRTGGTTSY